MLNILFILFSGYLFHKKGGLNYLERILNPKSSETQKIDKNQQTQHDYGFHYKGKKSLFEIMPNDTSEIIFLGNSITDLCDWHELFGNKNIKNRGIRRDVINGVINRLDEIVSSNPKKIFLMIGINDLLVRKNTGKQILTNYERLITLMKEKAPKTKLYIQSILPIHNPYDSSNSSLNNNDIIAINAGLINLTKNYDLTYVNLFDLMKTEMNELDTVYSFDGIHLNGKGYLVWKKAIEHYVNN